MSISSVAACRRLRDARMVSGTKHFPVEGPCFIVICGAIMSLLGHKKILMRAVDEKQVISL